MGDSGSANSSRGQTSFFGLGAVFCSVCLDAVKDVGERSIAKLKCGHHFHLDCIGSAFNAKGSMQCPNCRSVEEGQWLYANGVRRLEDSSMDGIDQDAYELFAGIINILRPNEDLHSRHLHLGSFLPSYQHVSVVLEGANPPPSAFADLLVHVLYSRHDGLSNSVHTCPYLAAQRMAFDESVGASYSPAEPSPLLQNRRHSGNSPRVQTGGSSERGTWSSHAAENLESSRTVANADNAASRAFPYERRRWSRPVAGNHIAASYGGSSMQFGQTGANRRSVPQVSRGNSTPFRHNASNQGQRVINQAQASNTPPLRQGSMDNSRRSRQREWPSDMFPERNRSLNGPPRRMVREDSAIASGSAVGWQRNIQGYPWARDGHSVSHRIAYDGERYWHANQHMSTAQQAEGMTSDSIFHRDLHSSDGSQQARMELRSPFEGHPSQHARVNPIPGFPPAFMRDGSVLGHFALFLLEK
ncbi:hypothetical protein O6H91_10G093600 [Diphasiastrum complanatum]|uniref:Uncharacterized protein n=1 Tax=Diphasiastrum complanatum TaxID=34168 RepID=A0ACC2CJM9_DIPCM|nr:hypothetical protein O6H91_10G093600 [Diphasiastrum complanatum]